MEGVGKVQKRVYNAYQKNKKRQKSRLKKLLNDRSTDLGLPHDIVEYFIRVQKSLCQPNGSNNSNDKETKMQLLTNVCDQIKENPLDYCSHHVVSVTIQKLVSMMDITLLNTFLGIVQSYLMQLIDDKYASHIIQTTIDTIADNNVYKMQLESIPHVDHLFNLISENFLDLMTKVYASHVVCSYVQLIGGIKMDQNITSSRSSRTKRYNTMSKNHKKTQSTVCTGAYAKTCSVLPKHYQKKLKKIIRFTIHYFSDISSKNLSENFVGVFICVLASAHRTKKSKVDALVAPLWQLLDSASVLDPSTSYLIQSMCLMCTEKSFEKICEVFIQPNFNELLTHPCGNYVIQAYMSGVQDNKLEATNIAEKIIDKLDEILNQGNFQVVVKLIDMIHDNNVDRTICERLTLSILSTFKFDSTSPSVDIIYQLLSTEPFDSQSPLAAAFDGDSKFNYHGSILVEKLFGISKLVVDSFCALYIRHLKSIMCNRYSGHIVNAFLESPLTTSKDVNKIIKVLMKEKNHVVTIPLICSKYGSYSFECLWNYVNIEIKEKIALSLDSRRNLLENNHFGAIVSSNCNLALFHSDRDAWRNIYNQ